MRQSYMVTAELNMDASHRASRIVVSNTEKKAKALAEQMWKKEGAFAVLDMKCVPLCTGKAGGEA